MGPVSVGGVMLLVRMFYHGMYIVAAIPITMKNAVSEVTVIPVAISSRRDYFKYLDSL